MVSQSSVMIVTRLPAAWGKLYKQKRIGKLYNPIHLEIERASARTQCNANAAARAIKRSIVDAMARAIRKPRSALRQPHSKKETASTEESVQSHK